MAMAISSYNLGYVVYVQLNADLAGSIPLAPWRKLSVEAGPFCSLTRMTIQHDSSKVDGFNDSSYDVHRTGA